ncbi:MAG: hypothetical protein CMB31_05010 [Euryarchaeota archaeon]|nr:hypothetical protein [Euryarchaeota archaeon]
MIEIIAGLLFIFIMIPSAITTWYSRCLNIRLSYAFLLMFLPLIIVSTIASFAPGIADILWKIYAIIASAIIIYGTYRQFTGKCKLGAGSELMG